VGRAKSCLPCPELGVTGSLCPRASVTFLPLRPVPAFQGVPSRVAQWLQDAVSFPTWRPVLCWESGYPCCIILLATLDVECTRTTVSSASIGLSLTEQEGTWVGCTSQPSPPLTRRAVKALGVGEGSIFAGTTHLGGADIREAKAWECNRHRSLWT